MHDTFFIRLYTFLCVLIYVCYTFHPSAPANYGNNFTSVLFKLTFKSWALLEKVVSDQYQRTIVNIGSGNGLVPSNNKVLFGQCWPWTMVSLGHSEWNPYRYRPLYRRYLELFAFCALFPFCGKSLKKRLVSVFHVCLIAFLPKLFGSRYGVRWNVHPMKCVLGFLVLRFVVVESVFIDLYEAITNILQCCFSQNVIIARLPSARGVNLKHRRSRWIVIR